MYDPALKRPILEILGRWGRLPQSDLLSRLTPVQLVRFEPKLIRDLATDGMIEVLAVGDEQVIQITERGRQAVGTPGK